MINIIWFFILAFGIGFGILSGRGEAVSKSIIASSDASVKLMISLLGIMCLWCGVMKIAEKSGLMNKIASLMRPILKVLFKDASKDERAIGPIVMNLTANMMGLSNAATPFGIKAMDQLSNLNKKKEEASDDMALFLVLNAACIQLVPTTVISIRAAMGSKNPAETIIPAIITTTISAIVGVVCCKILQRYF
ncbi:MULTISPECIES: nucleoside recognition domain-containing protein [Clostridium]|uniref:Spore maturation protein A n=1 Tax=Clostridium ragsdalei P11 TaxID=1353534 RepID=A0A1A6ANW4_9CLOT|nr:MULTISPECIES: nucleoside recognition domain-containing protein [Clostridium]OBR91751.1 spore maturation protein A [Clostridium ragsdalei P11]QXE19411.1 spore maturation protein [Clostridium sp. 001]